MIRVLLILLLLAGCAARPSAVVEPEPEALAALVMLEDFALEEEVLASEADAVAVESLPEDPCPCHDDIWDRIRAGFSLPESDHPRVVASRHWYRTHQPFLDRVAHRARPYLHYIVEEVEARGMPMEIALLPVVESAFDPYAYSHGRASGLWQFIPGTGRQYGLKQDWWYDGRRDVVESTRAALDYLQYLHTMFDGDWMLALAAYNTGEGNVARAVRRNQAAGRPTDFFSLQLPAETRGYAPKLLALRDLVANPEAWGIKLQPIADASYIEIVETDGQIDLALAAQLAEMPLNELYLLNPAYNRWATDPAGPHRLVLPRDRADRFLFALAAIPADERVSWHEHRVVRGETLSVIARRYRTTVGELQGNNRLNDTLIRVGQVLLVPAASRPAVEDPANNRMEYTVRRGDSLWRIGQQHGVGVGNLASWNAMTPNDTLREGQTLVIWMPTRAGHASGPMAEHTLRSITYTVRHGDSLARISQRFRVSVTDLMRWNQLDPQRFLQPGQRLRVYVDVTAQTGG